MAKNWVSQEVYDAMKGLASDKNEYEYNDSIGNVSERDKHGQRATDKYDIIGAYSPDLRKTLKNSNAQQTRDLIKEYGVARDAKTISNEIIAKKFGYEKAKATNPGADLSEYDATALYDELSAVDPSMATMLGSMSYQQAVDWQNGKMPEIKTPEVPKEPEAPKRTMWDVANDIVGFKKGYEGSYDAGNPEYWREHNNAQDYYTELESMGPEGEALASYLRGSNAANAEAYIAEHAPVKPMTGAEAGARGFNLIGNSGNTILSNIDKMYFDGNFGKDVADMFNMYGNTEGAKELAKNAAANGGNFDSFADYNRHNTNLAYMLAGQNAVQNMRRGYAEDATKFLDTWGNQLTGSASNIADYEYKDKALASDEKVAMAQDATNREQIASDERIAQMSADTQKAVAQIEADAASKGYSAETINTIISGVTDLILNGKSYAALQGFLDQYGIKLPEQPVTTTDTVVPSGLGGLTKGGLAGLIGETVTIKTNDTSKGTDTAKPVTTKPVDTKPVDTKPAATEDGDVTGMTEAEYNKLAKDYEETVDRNKEDPNWKSYLISGIKSHVDNKNIDGAYDVALQYGLTYDDATKLITAAQTGKK
jgi:hypothetical protein